MRTWYHLGLASVLFMAGVAQAQEPVPQAAPERSALDFTHCWAGCKAATRTDSRAGCPQHVAWYSRPGESPAYLGYFIGGGNACRGEAPSALEGTWGWDFHGHLIPRRVPLS